eukprot:GGOE01060213.1.p1 GENE.GGOE01060213.1~~GGOE01060213.1.p1  ORF type:complete len:539 (+),score=172.48 GGOE01060213.1:125-1741(+)
MRRMLPAVIMAATFFIWAFAVLHLPRRSGLRRPLPGTRGPPPPQPPEEGHLPTRPKPAQALREEAMRTEKAQVGAGAAEKVVPMEEEASASPDPTEQRREAVRAAMRHSWAGYQRYAWGHDELNPISKGYTDWRCQPACAFALTMIDGLDTLWVMDLKEEFSAAVRYISANVTFDRNAKVSVFETIIRLLGGLLSAYDLSHEEVLLQRALELGQRLLPAFGQSAFPAPLVNLQTGQAEHWSWTPNLILAEVASLQLEFRTLSRRSKQESFDEKGSAILRILQETAGSHGLLPTMLTLTGAAATSTYSIGAFGDSAYEYLLKLWVLDGDSRALDMFRAAKAGIKRSLLIHTPRGVAVGVNNGAQLAHEVEHLTCFAGGMFAMAHHYGVGDPDDLSIAEGIAAFCHQMHSTQTGLPPDTAFLQDGGAVASRDPKYILRPETVETYFYLWRITHKPIYREWGWALFEACDRWLKVDGGYAGMKNVNVPREGLNDKMESFWLAETLKYLFLLFSEDSAISLEDFVFNTEGHPLRRTPTTAST